MNGWMSEYVLHQKVNKGQACEMFFSCSLPVLYYKHTSTDFFISHHEKTLQFSESTHTSHHQVKFDSWHRERDYFQFAHPSSSPDL